MFHLHCTCDLEDGHTCGRSHFFVRTFQVLGSNPFQELNDGWLSVALEAAPLTSGEVSYMDEHSIVMDYLQEV